MQQKKTILVLNIGILQTKDITACWSLAWDMMGKRDKTERV